MGYSYDGRVYTHENEDTRDKSKNINIPYKHNLEQKSYRKEFMQYHSLYTDLGMHL